jgi:hypothetical protein
VADVYLVHGIVGKGAGSRAHSRATHLVFALRKDPTRPVGVRDATPFVVCNTRRLTHKRFTLVIENESAFPRHQVGYLPRQYSGLIGQIVDGIKLDVERLGIARPGTSAGAPDTGCTCSGASGE